jgi:hypothetical protein
MALVTYTAKLTRLVLLEIHPAPVRTIATTGLDKATEAKKRERALCKFREANGMADAINIDLTFAVDLNLAHMYHLNKNHKEALDLYTCEHCLCQRHCCTLMVN